MVNELKSEIKELVDKVYDVELLDLIRQMLEQG